MEISSLLLFAGALLVASGSPGPSTAALVARVLSRGAGDVLPFLAAMLIGEAIWLSMAVWGLAAVAQSFHLVFVAVKWAGVGYLAYLAWKMWTAPVNEPGSAVPARSSGSKLFLAGFSLTLGNPKIMLFYMALLPTIVDLKHLTAAGWAILVAVMLVVLTAVYASWLVAAAKARDLLRTPRAMKMANRFGAGMMAGAATAIATR
ncbi:LysE family translocator [Ruegeria sediminis]|uniref:LysE family translocator n=1 Tax=Ruegeria sediminis TaxID=2583820 RepID=A0ABY2X5P4_9RHOB|nr:LysE family translocator [Ruegeria sediminis]